MFLTRSRIPSRPIHPSSGLPQLIHPTRPHLHPRTRHSYCFAFPMGLSKPASSSGSNGPKQVTLNKFFTMPPGHKPILAQQTVDSLFNKQSRKKDTQPHSNVNTAEPQLASSSELGTASAADLSANPLKRKNDECSTAGSHESKDENKLEDVVSKATEKHSNQDTNDQVAPPNPKRVKSSKSKIEDSDQSDSDETRKRKDVKEKTYSNGDSKTTKPSSNSKNPSTKAKTQDSKREQPKEDLPGSTKACRKDSTSRRRTSSNSSQNSNLAKESSKAASVDKSNEQEEKEEAKEDEDDEDEDNDGEEVEDLADLARDDLDEKGGASWEKGKPVPYASLAHTFDLIDGTTKRLEITKYLSQYLAQVIFRSPDELLKVIYLCINRLCPDYEGIELGIGESLLIKAIGSSMGRTPAQVKAEFKKVGDLGSVARNSRTTQKTMFQPKLLTVQSVYQDLKTIATTSGHSSQTKKVGIITKMLASCQGEEAKFIIRSLEGKLRIGLAERTVLVALATAAVRTGVGSATPSKHKSSEELAKDIAEGINVVKAVYSEIPSYDLVIPALIKGGIKGLRENCKLTPGVPLKPMLAKPTKAISEVLDRFEGHKFSCEYKYDGERAQIHFLEDGSISIFSRNSENMSVKYPDMVDQLPRAIKKGVTRNFVLDAEAVAWDPVSRKILPFQELSKRKRKDVKSEDITIKVQIFAFDLLYLNDRPLINTDFANRRELLKNHFEEVDGEFSFAKAVDVDNVEEIQVFLDESVKAGCEGLMVKMLNGENATYEPSRRSMNWLKVKKDYLAGVGDSLDLVVVGAYYGRGKRTSVYGAFLLACYDPETETYQTICKLGTGFSEEDLESHHKKLQPLELTVKKNYYDSGDSKPDVWFEPKVVWEVLAADLSLSPVYSAAKGLCGDGSRGVSLRFPRYIRERDDKGPEDATGPDQVSEMYKRQVTAQQDGQGPRKKGKKGKEAVEDDFW